MPAGGEEAVLFQAKSHTTKMQANEN